MEIGDCTLLLACELFYTLGTIEWALVNWAFGWSRAGSLLRK